MEQKNITLVDSLFTTDTLKKIAVRNTAFVILLSLALWISAKIQIPFYPVPLTLQTMVIFLIGMLGGWRLGLATISFHYLLGIAGLPVFAGTPEKGIGFGYMLGPTGGYLVGFVFAVLITGFFARRNIYQNCFMSIPVLIIASISIYIPGVIWLSKFIGLEKAVQFGVTPFLYGAALKIILASLLVALGFRLQK